MTDEEKAIAWCEDLIVQSKEIMPQCSDALKAELAEQMEFAETALSTLRDRIAREKPEPLTDEDLERMGGEPVWFSGGGEGFWFLSKEARDYIDELNAMRSERPAHAYRAKPEPPEREADHGR